MATRPKAGSKFTIAVDTGGTFTDLVLSDERSVLGLYKASTTAGDLMEGITQALRLAAQAQDTDVAELLARTETFVYSTTHSTNALLTGKIARTAFVTTRGHRDTLLIREGGKNQVFNWSIPYPKPYIPARLTFELTERIFSDGAIGIPLDEAEVRGVLKRLVELEVEAIAVSLLWSTVNPSHEARVAELIEEVLPGVDYSLGHRVNRITREFRRGMATALDASLKPLMRRHFRDFEDRLRELGFAGDPFLVTHVSGGVLDVNKMIDNPLHAVDSGPALAPIAGIEYARAEASSDATDILVVDTGGTSFDASLVIGGRVAYTREKWIGPQWYGYMTGLPAVDTRSIGAGGGSIASIDAGGLLQVGPQSAGAVPGPVSYGRGGTEPTVTDAALILGYLDPNNFLGGKMKLDVAATRTAITERVAAPLRLDVESAAEAILVIASEHMRGHINDMTTAQGRDPRDCLMVAGGGAAGLNILRIARDADVQRVIIPKLAGGLSAVGGLYSDITATFSRPHYTTTELFDFGGVNRILKALAADAAAFLGSVSAKGERVRSFRCEARYRGQLSEIEVVLGDKTVMGSAEDVASLQNVFDKRYLELFAVNQPGAPLEIVSWLVEARVVRPKRSLALPGRSDRSSKATPSQVRPAYFDGRFVDTPVYQGLSLTRGTEISGPAVIEEPTTTIVLIPASTATVRDSHYAVALDQSIRR